MPPKSGLTLSQLAGINKARKIAEVIVAQKAALLKTLYTNLNRPKTFQTIADKVRPESEEKSANPKFIKSVISFALKSVLGEEKMAEINAFRDDYYAKRLRKTIKHNKGKKVVDKIHFLGGKAVWGKYGKKLSATFKAKVAEHGYVPWYDVEIAFLNSFLQDPAYCHASGGNKGELDYEKVVPLLNDYFHGGELVRSTKTVSSFLYKRARSWWSDDELFLLDTLLSANDSPNLEDIALELNNTHHLGIPVRTASAISSIVAKKKAEVKKIAALGITKKE